VTGHVTLRHVWSGQCYIVDAGPRRRGRYAWLTGRWLSCESSALHRPTRRAPIGRPRPCIVAQLVSPRRTGSRSSGGGGTGVRTYTFTAELKPAAGPGGIGLDAASAFGGYMRRSGV
jgi:hypothetical protein